MAVKGNGSQTKDGESQKEDGQEQRKHVGVKHITLTQRCTETEAVERRRLPASRESQKEDESKKKTPEEKIPKNPWNGESQKEDESKKNTPEEKIPKNSWNRFQQRLKGSGIGGDKKLLSALYREEQKGLQTLKVDEKQVQCGV